MLQPRSTRGSSWCSSASAWRRPLGRFGVGTRCARALLAGPPQYWSASSASATWVVGACTALSLKTTSPSRALRPPLAIDSLGGFCRPPCAFESGFGRATTISLICLFRQITGVWITTPGACVQSWCDSSGRSPLRAALFCDRCSRTRPQPARPPLGCVFCFACGLRTFF